MARPKRVPRDTSEITYPFRTVVPVASYRKFPDPVHAGLNHHTGYIPALLYPRTGFPNNENIRPAVIDRSIYKDIAESLKNNEGIPDLYHLKSKGELHVATAVRELGPDEAAEWFEENVRPYVPDDAAFTEFQKRYKLVEVLYEEGCSIVDGGHTDKIWSDPENQADVRATYTSTDPDERPNRNHLGVEWLVGVPEAWLPEIVRGRNTGLQVREVTLANHEGKFQWLKDLVATKPYGPLIAYRENEDRKEKPIDIRDVIALLAPFNRDLYSLDDEDEKKLPTIAFSSKKAVLDDYVADMEKGQTYTKLAGIATDILELHDLIHLEAVEAYNAKTRGRGGSLHFVDHRDTNKGQRSHSFYFTGHEGPDQLADGALYPILAAFSALVTTKQFPLRENPRKQVERFAWVPADGFEGVKRIWRKVAGSFMETTAELGQQLGRNPGAIGKSKYQWKNLYRDVASKAAP